MTSLDVRLMYLARAFARVAHHGQLRKDGEDYFKHVSRVATRVSPHGVRVVTVAYLHDILEDSGIDWGVIEGLGFPKDVIEDVYTLTRFGAGETYEAYIERVCKGSLGALQVKLADLADNLEERATTEYPGDEDIARLRARYIKADATIRAELERRKGCA